MAADVLCSLLGLKCVDCKPMLHPSQMMSASACYADHSDQHLPRLALLSHPARRDCGSIYPGTELSSMNGIRDVMCDINGRPNPRLQCVDDRQHPARYHQVGRHATRRRLNNEPERQEPVIYIRRLRPFAFTARYAPRRKKILKPFDARTITSTTFASRWAFTLTNCGEQRRSHRRRGEPPQTTHPHRHAAQLAQMTRKAVGFMPTSL